MKFGMIVRADNTGLGNQTYELAQMLKPDKIMIIDFTSYNGNEQHFEWYDQFDSVIVEGFPDNEQMFNFLNGLDVMLSCETFYNNETPAIARKLGVKTYLQYNFELFGSLKDRAVLLPDVLVSPSVWYFEYTARKFSREAKTVHLPPPTSDTLFQEAREINMSRDHKRIVHIAGRIAAKDRNGTLDVIEMLKHSKADYELVIYSQFDVDFPKCKDSRLTIITDNIEKREDMYKGFDAMVLPRRYAGLSLPMNEALMSGMPVFMTDVSPNDYILPKEWLVPVEENDLFRLKVTIPVYSVYVEELARRIDAYVNNPEKDLDKQKAFQIAYKNFAPERLLPKYEQLLGIEKG